MSQFQYEAELLVQALSAKGATLSTAESCTGGLIAKLITDVPGSSAALVGGVISYTNEIKEKLLGVPASTLEKYGAVSEPVAQAMAEGARVRLQADIAVSVTGLAGPGGDEYGNPVGTVFIGYADAQKSYAKEFHFVGDREEVRNQTTIAALQMVLELEVKG